MKTKISEKLLWAVIGSVIGFLFTFLINLLIVALTTGTLEGTVIEESSKAKIDSVFISIGDRYFTRTDSEGKYKASNIANGPYKVAFTKNGYTEKIVDVSIFGNSDKSIMLEKNKPTGSINKPKNDEKVPRLVNLRGEAKNILNDKTLWIVTKPYDSDGYWPQGSAINVNPNDGSWSGTAYLGEDRSADSGKAFTIFLILCDTVASSNYENYIANGLKTGNYPAIPLPKNVEILAQVIVTRE